MDRHVAVSRVAATEGLRPRDDEGPRHCVRPIPVIASVARQSIEQLN